MSNVKLFFVPIVLVSLNMIASSALAASFDCGKASTATEKAICATPSVNGLDAELGRLYERLLGELPAGGQAKARFKRGQRAWLQSRDARCGAAAAKTRDAFAACAEPVYERRINHLRAELGAPHRPDYPSNGDATLCGVCEYSGPDAAMGCAGYTTRSGCVSSKHCAWVVKRCPK